MANQNTIWVVIDTDEVLERLRELIDLGAFSEAKDLQYQLDALADKAKSVLSTRGGHLHLSTPCRTVMEMSITVAEEFPVILSGYRAFFGTKMGTGMGLDLHEAAAAAKKSLMTHEIELYDPKDESFKADFFKALDDAPTKGRTFELPPNLFDPLSPPSPEPKEDNQQRAILTTPEQSMQAEAAMLQAIMQQLSPPPPQQPQQQDQTAQQPNQDQSQEPRDLLEILHGQPVPGRDVPPQAQQSEPASNAEPNEPKDETQEKLAALLAGVQDRIPKLMSLADTNPDAFKKVMALVHKLVDVARTKKVQKGEVTTLTEELNKAIRLRLPVGSVKGRRKKVLVNGREVWRQMSAGQVLDSHGQAVSVKSSNAKADDGSEGKR